MTEGGFTKLLGDFLFSIVAIAGTVLVLNNEIPRRFIEWLLTIHF